MVEDQIHFVLARNESVEDRRVREQPDDGGDDEPLYRNERWQCSDCPEMGGCDVKGDLFESFSILYIRLDVDQRGKTRKEVGCTAVTTRDPSASSCFPPGRAVSPGWERRFFDRVVSNTLSDPSLSNNKISTAARLLIACNSVAET